MSDDVKIPLPQSLQEIVGALLFASESPLTAAELREAIRSVEPEEGDNREVMEVYKTCTGREVDAALKGLEKALDVAGCGFKLVCTGGTYRLQTTSSCGRYVRAMLKMDRPTRLGRASLETLAIIAYRQPITKSEIEEIRGVDVTANIKTLMDLQVIRLVGRSELPGHPFLYGTTPLFLEHFGLADLQQLNELDPTLQRSNPRVKAAAYKKPVKQMELEQAAEEQKAAEDEEKKAEQEEQDEATPDEETPPETEELALGEEDLENEEEEELDEEELDEEEELDDEDEDEDEEELDDEDDEEDEDEEELDDEEDDDDDDK